MLPRVERPGTLSLSSPALLALVAVIDLGLGLQSGPDWLLGGLVDGAVAKDGRLRIDGDSFSGIGIEYGELVLR